MTNTPTESEFDKELDHIMGWCSGTAHSPCWYDENITGRGLSGYDEDMLAKTAIKQAVEKHVIGEIPPESEHWRYNGEARGVIKRAVEQRKSLYGGDEK